MNQGILNTAANSASPSIGASSLVTDANSAFSGDPQLQRSASINTDPYLRFPASPMSFSSNNMSGASVVEGGSIVQQSCLQDQMQRQMAPSSLSLPALQDPGSLSQPQKKPRLDVRQEDILQQQVMQQLLQRQEPSQLQGQNNTQVHALIQQKILQQRQQQQQQQMLQSLSPAHRAQIQHQQQLRQQLQQQVMHQSPYIKRPFDSGICARRLMQYMYHQQRRPPDNNILYWRKFVAEYFSPRAKKKMCLSSYENIGNHALGVFPQAAKDAWQCSICGTKSGKGFEATFEVLPRLSKIKFDSGVCDELLFLDMPHECRLASGIMLLEYAKAVEESVYEHLHVVREGQLRVTFAPDLKILSWEFCTRRHEELLPRRLVAPQVNQLMQTAQKYQNAASDIGSSGVSPQDLRTNCNSFVTAGCQLAKNLELQSLNDLGFSKRYIRFLQIAEVVNTMKDLMTYSREHNLGPLESLKNYPRTSVEPLNARTQEADQVLTSQNLSNDQNTLNKLVPLHPSMNTNVNRNISIPGIINNSSQSTSALTDYQALLRQNSMNPNLCTVQREAYRGTDLQTSVSFQGSGYPSSITSSRLMVNPQLGSQKQLQLSASSLPVSQVNSSQANVSLLSQPNQYPQQRAIQQMLQEMVNSNRGTLQQSMNGPSISSGRNGPSISSGAAEAAYAGVTATASQGNGGSVGNSMGSANAASAQNNCKVTMNDNTQNVVLTRCNSSKSIQNSSTDIANNNFSLRQDMHLSPQLDELVQDISQEFISSGMFDIEPGDYAWKS